MENDEDNIRVCSLCNKMCVEPRSLTCLHSFCLQCLLQSIKGKNINSEKKTLSCPLCDEEYVVPKEGLRRNDFIYRLIKDEESTPSSKVRTPCNICPKDKDDPECKILLATSYCIECENEMCDRCNNEHNGQKSNKTHRVFGLGRQDDEEIAKDKRYNCVKHPKKQVELYCKRCEEVICITCFAETHKHHDCIDLDKYTDRLRDEVEKNCEDATGCLLNCNTIKDQLDAVEGEFLDSADETKANIDERCEELKEMVDRHAQKLREELESTRKSKQKQINEHREPLDKLITKLMTLKAYCSELASKGTSIEITRDISGINDRKAGLQRQQGQLTGLEVGSLSVFIKPKKLNNYLHDVDNIVGKVEVTTSGDTEGKGENRISLYDDVWGVTKLGGYIYILCRNIVYNSIKVYSDRRPYSRLKNFRLKRILLPIDMVSLESDDCLYVSDKAYKGVWQITQKSCESKWLSGISWPFTMSVSGSGHLVILRSSQPSNLELYGLDACLVDEFKLPAICQLPRHAVETSDGAFVILHKYKDVKGSGGMIWSVSKVNRFGQIVRSFNPKGRSEILHRPCHLVLRYDNEVFVADLGRDNITQLDSDLRWSAVSLTRAETRVHWPPRRLYYDAKEDTIYVGQEFGGVQVHKLDQNADKKIMCLGRKIDDLKVMDQLHGDIEF